MAGCTAYAETNPLATRHTELAKKANPSLVDKVLLEVLPASRPHSRAVSRLQAALRNKSPDAVSKNTARRASMQQRHLRDVVPALDSLAQKLFPFAP